MANNPKVKGIKYGTLRNYLRQDIDADTLYFITDKGLLYRGSEIVVPTKVIDITPAQSGQDYYTFTIETYSDDPANPDTFTFDVYSKAALTTIIQTLQLALNNHTGVAGDASNTVKGHTYLSDDTDSDLAAASGKTAATPLAVKRALAAANAYTDEQIANLSQGMRIIGTYGLAADNPDETTPLNEIDASEGDTYICISTMTVAYVNASGIAVSSASLNPGDYIICVQAAVSSQGTVTTPARWTIVANTNSNVVTANETLNADTVILGNGNKTVKKLAPGTTGQFLRQTANGARWEGHTNLDHGIAYGVCDDVPGTVDLEVDISGITLQPYAIVAVNFVSGISDDDATLNVSRTGATPIFYHNDPIRHGIVDKGDTATFMFVPDFDWKSEPIHAWVLISIDRAPDNTPSNLSAFNNDIQALLVCTTAANNNSKTITRSDIYIKAGSVFAVRFSNAVGANSTLNINGGGAKNIKHRNANITIDQIRGGDTATFIYDGSYYHLLSVDRAFDSAPASGSHSLVDSDAVYQAIQTAVQDSILYWEEMQ